MYLAINTCIVIMFPYASLYVHFELCIKNTRMKAQTFLKIPHYKKAIYSCYHRSSAESVSTLQAYIFAVPCE